MRLERGGKRSARGEEVGGQRSASSCWLLFSWEGWRIAAFLRGNLTNEKESSTIQEKRGAFIGSLYLAKMRNRNTPCTYQQVVLFACSLSHWGSPILYIYTHINSHRWRHAVVTPLCLVKISIHAYGVPYERWARQRLINSVDWRGLV